MVLSRQDGGEQVRDPHGPMAPGLCHKLAAPAAEEARRDYFDMDIDRHEIAPLADRIWHLRHQFTSYDAAFLALAEALDAPLHTCDAKLAAGGRRARVRLHGKHIMT